ncbi:serrate RNA effector molecule homolog isoform X2 [Hemibagrus wyckioides]|uniref:serrate RNA effector molecule homolog isoform X2 n=1 Tax=Hemibagrus wyckioides TaxID=337641 RepID=UPI00266CFC9F|nr:serrate RNA effector molecule homolog isoform X2 [Hemibagrus wyckioides]
MADSDDEYDRRRRDKFRRERSDYDRSREREDRRRDDWSDRRPSAREWDRGRERRSRGEYREYERGRRERFSPPRHDMSPQQKRMRRDWDDHGGDPYHGGYDLGYGGGGGPSYAPPQPWGHPDIHLMQPHHALPIQARLGNIHDLDLGPPPPVMKTFKEFLLSLDDSVDETESVKRYNEYKIDFRRQQMQEFFLAHKGEEWFRSKYHPDESGKRKAEAHAALQNRLNAFQYLMENGWFDNISMDIDRAPQILKILDAAVIKMEGGTENDLRILEQPVEDEEERERLASGGPSSENQKREENRGAENDRKPSTEKDNKEGESEDVGMKDADAEAGANKPDKEAPTEEISEPKKLSKKRKRKHSGDSEDEASASESESDSDSDSNSHCSEKPVEREREVEAEGDGEGEGDGRNEGGEEKEEEEEEEGEADVKGRKEMKQSEREKEKEEKKVKDDQPPKPRPLHMTCSLFMRSIAPSISKAEIVALCRRYPGFMRVCLSEPQPERRFFRRCWVTFDRGVNIKEICWNLQNIRLRDCELAPGVNRDLARRVRNVNGITQHKQILRNDIKLSAKLIHALDEREGLWGHGETHTAELPVQNPILKNITDYLIEEVSAEEEELLGNMGGVDSEDGNKEGNPTEITVERDEKLVKVLDRLLFYLRIVHSIDYYNMCEYTSEDEMPNRCGIIHVRGPIPPNRITHREVSDWQKTFEEKLSPLFSVKETLAEEEATKMGRKDPEQEVEKFVSANTQELGKDKWLCPLSGKKFKGPEFVRKHILNKHGDKIEEVKKEVEFFNNFLMDAKRPSIPEIKPLPPPGPTPGVMSPGGPPFHPQGPQGLLGFGQPRPPVMGYGGPPYPPNQYGGGGRGNYDSFRGQGGYPGKPRNNRMMRGDPRNIIEYRDLDAPDDVDFF